MYAQIKQVKSRPTINVCQKSIRYNNRNSEKQLAPLGDDQSTSQRKRVDDGEEPDHPLQKRSVMFSGMANKFKKPASNLTQKKSMPGNGVIQRLTGFEVELHVPAYSTASASRQPNILKTDQALTGGERTDIKNYLGGGLKYGRNYGIDPNDYYDITADHGPYKGFHATLIRELGAAGYIETPFIYNNMTNLEYRTPPIEERTTGSDALVNNIADAVKAHASNTATKATQDGSQAIIAPAQDLKTGFPETAFKKLTHDNDGAVSTAVDAAKSNIQPFVYYQANSGVLPSEIPALFEKEARDIWELAGTNEQRGNVVMKGRVLVLTGAYQTGAAMTADVTELLGFNTANDLKPIIGWLSLLTQYLMAYNLELSNYDSGGTAKNLVGFLSKTRLHETGQALPARLRPVGDGSETGLKWKTLLERLLVKVGTFDIATKAGVTLNEGRHRVLTNPSAWLEKIRKGLRGWEVNTARPLGLDDGQENFAPKLTIEGEQAIPLEERFSPIRLTTEEQTPDTIDTTLKADWRKSVDRRLGSTVAPQGDPSKIAISIHAKIYQHKIAIPKLITRANGYGIDVGTFRTTFRDNMGEADDFDIVFSEDAAVISANTALIQLRADIITAINAYNKTRNDAAHVFAPANYRDIQYNWKDDDNYSPILTNKPPNVWVKKSDGSLLKATIHDGTFKYTTTEAKEILKKVSGTVKKLKSPFAWEDV